MIDKISELVTSHGYSLASFEVAARLPTNRLSKWRNGKGEPKARELYRIAKLLDVTMEYLADDLMDRPTPPLTDDERMVLRVIRVLRTRESMRRLIGTGGEGLSKPAGRLLGVDAPSNPAGAAVWDDPRDRTQERGANQNRNPALKPHRLPASKVGK
jgi:transcriptional regulator with XRE-family HTH domain